MEEAETKRVSIHEKNSRILTLFPSWASGLLRRRRYVDKIYDFIDSLEDMDELKLEIEMLDGEGRLTKKEDIVVDKNKTILLTYAFGDMYTQALALATGGNIRADVVGEGIDLDKVVEAYFKGKLEKETPPVFLRVYNELLVEDVPEKETNELLELRRMLAGVGLVLNLDSKKVEVAENANTPEKEREWPSGEFVSVDPYNWFCSNKDFLEDCPAKGPHIPIENILKHYDKNEENALLLEILEMRSPKVHADPLPICTQLLAVLLAAYNYECAPIRKVEIKETWQILEALSIT